MSIELFCEHNYHPIADGNNTVGLKCSLCSKVITEMHSLSNIIVTEKGIENLGKVFRSNFLIIDNSKRKDPRF